MRDPDDTKTGDLWGDDTQSKKRGRKRIYQTNAERQRAYRKRKKLRQQQENEND